MREIKRVVKDIETNLREAREKIAIAYNHMDSHRPYADWQREMASAHIGFNAKGHEIVKRMIADMSSNTSPLAPGMRAVYEEIHADLIRETGEVQAMIDNYGR